MPEQTSIAEKANKLRHVETRRDALTSEGDGCV